VFRHETSVLGPEIRRAILIKDWRAKFPNLDYTGKKPGFQSWSGLTEALMGAYLLGFAEDSLINLWPRLSSD
jgi:hypothetical protein